MGRRHLARLGRAAYLDSCSALSSPRHILVPAGGVSSEGIWVEAKHPHFLVPGYALSEIFRAKIKAGLKALGLLQPDGPCWNQKWNVHCRPAGSGIEVLNSMGRYLFRVAITNSRLEHFENEQVTFRYRDNQVRATERASSWRPFPLGGNFSDEAAAFINRS